MDNITKGKQIGDWVYTTERHECLARIFETGTYVQIIDIDPKRGYAIQDANGNKIIEIGWRI